MNGCASALAASAGLRTYTARPSAALPTINDQVFVPATTSTSVLPAVGLSGASTPSFA